MRRLHVLVLSVILSLGFTPPRLRAAEVSTAKSSMSASAIDANVSKLVYQDTLSTGKNYLDRRHALVGANCMVNRLNTTVSVVGGISHLEYLVDKNLDNGATFADAVKAESCLFYLVTHSLLLGFIYQTEC